MTHIYLIRHCQPRIDGDDRVRSLTDKGIADIPKVTRYLEDKGIDRVYCSPYKRSVDTISNFCSKYSFDLEIRENFREVNIGNDYQGEFMDTVRHLWEDYSYRLSDVESYGQVQRRCIAELLPILREDWDKNIVISMHSTAMSTIIKYFKPDFVWEDYFRVLCHTPYAALLSFDGDRFCAVEYHSFD